MLRPEDDYETWVLYLTEFLVENDLYIQMFNDFDRLLQYYDENDKLPDPIEGYSYLFINVSANLIVQNITELEIPDSQQLKDILQILSNVGIHATSLFAKGYEKFEESLRYIFSRKTPIYNSARKNPNTNQTLFCNVIKNYLNNEGLNPLFQVAESYTSSTDVQDDQPKNPLKNVSDLTPNSSNPANSSNSIIYKVTLLIQLIQNFQLFRMLNDLTTIKMVNRIIPAFSAILRRFDKAKLRNTDSNGIYILVKEFVKFSTDVNTQQNSESESNDVIEVDSTDLLPINDTAIITRVVLSNFKVIIFDVLNFSMFCLKSDILEKQMMAANILKMLRSYVVLSTNIQKWAVKNQEIYFSLILNQKFNENVLAVLKSPYHMLIEFAPPTNEQLYALWSMTIKMNPSSTNYTNNNNSNSFSYSNFANSSGLNSPSNSGSGIFTNIQQNERDTYISFILDSIKAIGEERTTKFLNDILVISLPEQQQQQQQQQQTQQQNVNTSITRNFIDVLQIIASKSDTSISERIAHFIIDLLKDGNYQEIAFSSIKEMTKDKGQSSLSIKQLLMNYCRSQLMETIEQKKKQTSVKDNDESVTRSLLEIMQCLIQNSYQKSKDVDEDLINLVLYFLDGSKDEEVKAAPNSSETNLNSKKIDSNLIFDFVRTCCVRTQYNLTPEQFDKLWSHVNPSDFAYLSNIIMKRGISFLTGENVEESIKEKLKSYDYSKSELNFVDFVSYFIFSLNKSKGIICAQQSNDRNKFPTSFSIKFQSKEVAIDGFEFLTRILTECKDKATATVATTRIITFITRMPNQSQAAQFLLSNFLAILSSDKSAEKEKSQFDLEESKMRVCNLLYEYVAIEEESLLCLEDFNLRSHKLPSNKNKIRITIQSQQLNIYVKPSIKVEHLCMKVALRMGCKVNNVCLVHMGRELNRFWSLKDYSIKTNCVMDVYLKSPQQLQQQFEYANSYYQNVGYGYQNQYQQQLKSFQQIVPTVDILASHTLYNCGLTNLLLDILREYNTDTISKEIHSDDEKVKSKAKVASELVSSVWRLLNILETDSSVLEAASDPSSASLLLRDSKTPLELLYNIQCIVISINNWTFGTSNNESGSDDDNGDDALKDENNEGYEDDDDDGIKEVQKFERYRYNRSRKYDDDEEEDEEEEEGFDDEEFEEIRSKNLANKRSGNKNSSSNNSGNQNAKNQASSKNHASRSSKMYSSSSSSSSSSLNLDADPKASAYVTDEIITFLLDGKIYDIGLLDAYLIIFFALKKLIYHRIRKQMKAAQGEQGGQNSNQNQVKRLKLKLKSKFLKQNEMAVKLVNNILTKLEVVKSKDFKQIAARLLHDLASFYPEETCQELFSENSKLSSLLLKLDPDTLVLLSQIFPALPDKPLIFSFLSSFLFSVDEKLCENFCKVICEIINEDCKTEELTKELCTRLKIRRKPKNESESESEVDADSLVKNPFLNGYCLILEKIFGLQKSTDIVPNIDVLDSLVYYFVEDCDEITQESILNIIKSILSHIPESEKRVSELLLPYLSIDSKQWNFDPRRYEKTSIYTGLKNLGATCYLNSVLQQLFMNKTFLSKFMSIKVKEENLEQQQQPSSAPNESKVNKNNKNDRWILCLQHLFARLQYSKMPFLSTLDFCNNFIFHDNMTINTREQQDASEFFQALLDKLPKEVSSCFTGKIVNIIQSDPNSETVRLENGDKIQFRKENFESFFLLRLDVKGYKNLEQSIEKYLEGEDLQYTVEEYNRKIDAKHFTRIEEAPEFFVVQLKRFEYDVRTWNRYKVNDEFEFPFLLNIQSLMNKDTTECFAEANLAPTSSSATNNNDAESATPNNNNNNDSDSTATTNANNSGDLNLDDYDYELTGIVIHDGHVEGGHYYSFIKQPSSNSPLSKKSSSSSFNANLSESESRSSECFYNYDDDDENSNRNRENENDGKWYSFNDNQVEEISLDDLKMLSFGSSKFQSANSFSPSAFILFYSKIKKDKQATATSTNTSVEDGFTIDPGFMKIIENENKLFMHNQCVFRAPVMNLIATQIKDWKVVLSFILNVTIHSKQVDYSNYIFENFMNILKSLPTDLKLQIKKSSEENPTELVELTKKVKSITSQRQNEALSIILSQEKNVKEAIFQCSTDQIIRYFVNVINKLIQANDPSMSKGFILYLCDSLKEIMPVWKQTPFITAIICDYSIQNKLDCTASLCDLIINLYKHSSYNYIVKHSSSNGSNNQPIDHLSPIKEVDLKSVFKTLSFLFNDFMTKEKFYNVFDIYDAIFRSQENAADFLKFVELAIDHSYMTFDEFFELISRNNEVQYSIIAKTVVISKDPKALTKKLALFRQKINHFDLLFSRILLRYLTFDDSLRIKCIDLATASIFYLMVSESPRIRNNAEYSVLGVFPEVSPLEDFQKAEDLLDVKENFPNDVFEEYFDIINKFDIITEEVMGFFLLFIKQVVVFCNSISSSLTRVVNPEDPNSIRIQFNVNEDIKVDIAGKQCGMIFANFIRVISWIYARTKTRDPVLIEAVWHLFVAIGKSGCLICCNKYEIVRLFQTMQICISKLDEIKLNEFATAIFPITFSPDKKLNETLFISLFDLIGKEIESFLQFDGFKQTFFNFFKLNDRIENINKATSKLVEAMNKSKKFSAEVIKIACNFISSNSNEVGVKITWQAVSIALFKPLLSNKLFARIIAFIHKQIYTYSGHDTISNPAGQVFYSRPIGDKLVQIMGLLGKVMMNKLKTSSICEDDDPEINQENETETETGKVSKTTLKQMKEIILNNASKFATMKACMKTNREIIVSFCKFIKELESKEEEEKKKKKKKAVASNDNGEEEEEEDEQNDFTLKVLDKLLSLQVTNNVAWDHYATVVQLSNDLPSILEAAFRYLNMFGISSSTKYAFESLERKLCEKVDGEDNSCDVFKKNEDEVVKFVYNVVVNLDKLDDITVSLLDFMFQKFDVKRIKQVFGFVYRKYCATTNAAANAAGGGSNKNKNKMNFNLNEDEVDICEDEDDEQELNDAKLDEQIVTLIRLMADILQIVPDSKKNLLDSVHFNHSIMETWPEAAEEFIPLFLSNE